MASSKVLLKTTALLKLIVAVVVTGLVASLLFVPYFAGFGAASNAITNKFLDAQCNLKQANLDQSTTIYARDGVTKIATLYKDNRSVIKLAAIPKIAQDALIDTEDRRFYQHHGLDIRGLARAAVNDSGNNSTQGASTLTQQLVKQTRFYEAGSDKAKQNAATADTTDRKIYEAKCALKLEQEFTKHQILEKYFNIAFFGEQSYGIDVAARNYFNVTPQKLTVPEAAMLAGLVKNPTLFDPFQHPTAARERRNEVIDNMVVAGNLTQAQANKYKKVPFVLNETTRRSLGAQGCTFAFGTIENVGFFCDYAVNWLEKTGGLSQDQLETGGYKIITSIDPTLQNTATTKEWKAFPSKSPTALVQPAVDPTTGEVTAFITNKHYNTGLKHAANDPSYTVNPLFTNATGGSGSTFKYFTMIAALTAGVQPDQALTTAGAAYFPKNCGEDTTVKANGITKDAGPTLTFSNAFAQSSNIYFVGMEDQIFNCDLSTIVKTAQNLGLTSLSQNGRVTSHPTWTVAQRVTNGNEYTFTLGQVSVSPLELARAYGVAANDGVLCQSRPILSVTASDGKSVPFKQATCTRKMSQWVARTALKIMMGPTTNGTASQQMYSNFFDKHPSYEYPVAGKTGTNNASKNGKDSKQNAALWFVGVTPRLVSASAMFNPDHPTKAIRGVPGFPGDSAANDAYGAVSSIFWAKSFGSTVAKKRWSWPSPYSVTNGQQVPQLRGYSAGDATQRLKDAGFKGVQYPIECGSNVPPGFVAYNGPDYAAPGSTVYFCMSNGKPLSSPPAPPKKVVKKPKKGAATPPPGIPGQPGIPGLPIPAPTNPKKH